MKFRPAARKPGQEQTSLPSRGAWIEICWQRARSAWPSRRSPHGERGLKFRNHQIPVSLRGSLPSRGAWIEIVSGRRQHTTERRRSPHGERGLKSWSASPPVPPRRRSPHGERGLKCVGVGIGRAAEESLPSRGAWIEIVVSPRRPTSPWSLPSRGAWIEIGVVAGQIVPSLSLPSRGAWIEIPAL